MRVKGFGKTSGGLLADVETEEESVSRPIALFGSLRGIKQVASSTAHNLVVTEQGEVWGWGSVKYGLLGSQDDDHVQYEQDDDQEGSVQYGFTPVPLQIEGLRATRVTQAACAPYHNLALSEDGQVWAWGSAQHGRLGIEDVSQLESMAGSAWGEHKLQPVPTRVCGLVGQRVTQVACAPFHSLALTDEGQVWAWGSARGGLLGISDSSSLPTFPDDENEVFNPTPTRVEGLQGVAVTQVCLSRADPTPVPMPSRPVPSPPRPAGGVLGAPLPPMISP